MSVRDYFGSFFTREYWEALGGLLFGLAFASHTIREDFWERAEREADTEEPQ